MATLVGNRRWCFLNVHCTFQFKWHKLMVCGLHLYPRFYLSSSIYYFCSLQCIIIQPYMVLTLHAMAGVVGCELCCYHGGIDTYYMGHVVEVSYTPYNKL